MKIIERIARELSYKKINVEDSREEFIEGFLAAFELAIETCKKWKETGLENCDGINIFSVLRALEKLGKDEVE